MSGWSLEFASRWFLLFLVLVPVIFLFSRGSLAGLSGGRKKVAIALRTIALLLVVLAMSRTRVMKENPALSVIFVVDSSDSIRRSVREQILEYIERDFQAQRDRNKGDQAGLVLFGRDAGIEVPASEQGIELSKLSDVVDEESPGPVSVMTVIDRSATDMQGAIRLAAAHFSADVGGKRIVLFTDGNQTNGEVLDEIRNARALGVTVDVVPLRSSTQSEMWVEKVVVDPEVQISQPYDIQVVVGSNAAAKARVSVYENGALISREDAVYDLKKGKTVVPFTNIRHDKADFYKYDVRLEPVESGVDVIDENNTGTAFVLIRGEPKILFVLPGGSEEEFEEERARDAQLLLALYAEKIKVDVLRADFLPNEAGEYFDYDAIVFSNVGAHEIPDGKMNLIHGLVYGIGIGFVMIGGENSFGAGGYQGTPIEKLLPVRMDIPQKKVLPNGALAFVVHSCELGNGNWWARQVVQRAIRILSPRDYCGVLYHDSIANDRWLFPMTKCTQKSRLIRKLRNFNPGDMMSFQQIFNLAAKGLKETNAAVKHMIILTDGDPAAPNSADVRALVDQERVTITTICYGAHGNSKQYLDAMQKLAEQGNGKFYHLTDPKKLPEIFIREATKVRKSLLSNKPFTPGYLASSPFTGALEKTIAESGGLPILGGHVVTTVKPLANLHLDSEPTDEKDPTRDPVLASWHYGLGKAVAFTSDGGRNWGREWAKWPGYRRFWAETIRWVSRGRSEAPFRVSRQMDGERARVIIDVIDETSGRLDSGLSIEASVVSPGPDHSTTQVKARPTSAGRYELDFPADKEGTYTVTFEYERPDGTKATYTTGVSVSYSAEFRHRGVNETLLRQLADASGGRYFGDVENQDAQFYSRDYIASKSVQDIWRTLLTVAIVLFFADIFTRRVMIDYAGAWQKSAAFVTGVFGRRKEVRQEDEGLANLLRKKEELRAKQGSTREATYEAKESVEPAELAGDAGASIDQRGSGSTPKKDTQPQPEKKSEASGYTGRLLAAKKRALRDKDKGDNT